MKMFDRWFVKFLFIIYIRVLKIRDYKRKD